MSSVKFVGLPTIKTTTLHAHFTMSELWSDTVCAESSTKFNYHAQTYVIYIFDCMQVSLISHIILANVVPCSQPDVSPDAIAVLY